MYIYIYHLVSLNINEETEMDTEINVKTFFYVLKLNYSTFVDS